jgi:hypothetical protein
MMIDATIVREHQHSAGAQKNGEQAIGRSSGGLTTKIHVLVDALGNPLEVMLTPGRAILQQTVIELASTAGRCACP